MTQVNQSILNGMLKNIPDPKLRKIYGHILNGDFPFKVYCNNPQKLAGESKQAHQKGALVGYIDNNGKVIDDPVTREDGTIISGLESSRDRFDGRKGFKCYCGNWSIQCEAEKPHLKQSSFPVPPTSDELQAIFDTLRDSGNPQGMEFVNGVLEYDGFKIEKVN